MLRESRPADRNISWIVSGHVVHPCLQQVCVLGLDGKRLRIFSHWRFSVSSRTSGGITRTAIRNSHLLQYQLSSESSFLLEGTTKRLPTTISSNLNPVKSAPFATPTVCLMRTSCKSIGDSEARLIDWIVEYILVLVFSHCHQMVGFLGMLCKT